MYETIICVTTAVGFIGSVCSILAYAGHVFDEYRRRRDERRKKMVSEENEPGAFGDPRL